jgi:hypothetical protein
VIEVAVSATVAGLGSVDGAEYVTAAPDAVLVAESVPHVAPLQPAPDNDHVTPLVAASFVTVAVKLAVPPIIRPTVVCERVTAMAGGAAVIVIDVAEVFVPSVTEVAVNVTLAGFGTLAGAV